MEGWREEVGSGQQGAEQGGEEEEKHPSASLPAFRERDVALIESFASGPSGSPAPAGQRGRQKAEAL